MNPILRPYQSELINRIFYQWQTHRRILAQLPTGGDKSVIFGATIASHFVRAGLRVLLMTKWEAIEVTGEGAWDNIYADLVAHAAEKGYKAAWIRFRLEELKPPLTIWTKYAQMMKYFVQVGLSIGGRSNSGGWRREVSQESCRSGSIHQYVKKVAGKMARLLNILRSTKLVQPICCLVNVLITSRTSRNVSPSFKL